MSRPGEELAKGFSYLSGQAFLFYASGGPVHPNYGHDVIFDHSRILPAKSIYESPHIIPLGREGFRFLGNYYAYREAVLPWAGLGEYRYPSFGELPASLDDRDEICGSLDMLYLHADRTLRPFLRLRANTALPSLVLDLFLKPCFLFLLRLDFLVRFFFTYSSFIIANSDFKFYDYSIPRTQVKTNTPSGKGFSSRKARAFSFISSLFSFIFKYSLALALFSVYNSFKLLDRSFLPVDNLLISPLLTVEKGLRLVDNLKPYFSL